jgi:rhodanese-related sulfurtransferase
MRNYFLVVIGLVSMLVLAACGAGTPAGGAAGSAGSVPAVMNVGALKAKLDANENLFLLDVRTPEEFAQDGRVSGATLIPLQELNTRLSELPRDTPIACICRSGNRSTTACDLLVREGFTATNVAGGMNAWKAAGYPTE